MTRQVTFPAVTIVVLTYNRRREVLRTLHKLCGLPEQCPVVVVDNASSDGTAEAVARAFPQVTVVRQKANAGAAGRNRGLAAAQTPYVAFCDDDTWWDAGAISRAALLFDAHPSLAVLCAQVLVGEAGSQDPVSLAMANSPLEGDGLPGRAILGFMAGASVVRAEAFTEVGGYCPRLFLGGEEELVALDLAARGWRMAYCEELVVRHFPSRMRDAAGRRVSLARNAIWVAWLRLPWPTALRTTLRHLLGKELAGMRAKALRQVLSGLPWALSNRRVVPARVARMRRAIPSAVAKAVPGSRCATEAPTAAGATVSQRAT
jgi:GT2 family glycosyltransferase